MQSGDSQGGCWAFSRSTDAGGYSGESSSSVLRRVTSGRIVLMLDKYCQESHDVFFYAKMHHVFLEDTLEDKMRLWAR